MFRYTDTSCANKRIQNYAFGTVYIQGVSFEMFAKCISGSLTEPSLPKIESSDATVSWYNREPRVLPVGGSVETLSGTEVTLTCKYSAFPEPDVKWTVLDEEGDPLPDAGYDVINGSLVLRALQPSDSAQYVCSVKNVAGTASASTVLKVVGKYFSFLYFSNGRFPLWRASWFDEYNYHDSLQARVIEGIGRSFFISKSCPFLSLKTG